MVKKNLDFRSDTTTWPSPEMREAAAKAAVGDMGYGEDPSVNELERVAAEIFGKEAAIFCTSGTQGNAVSMLAHTDRGDSFICHTTSPRSMTWESTQTGPASSTPPSPSGSR